MSLLKDLGLETTLTKSLLGRQKSQRKKARNIFGALLADYFVRQKNLNQATTHLEDIFNNGTIEKAKNVVKFNKKAKIVNIHDTYEKMALEQGIDLKELFKRRAQDTFIANELDGNRELVPLNSKLIKDYSNAEGTRLYTNHMKQYNNFMAGPTTIEEYNQPLDNALTNIERRLKKDANRGLGKPVENLGRKLFGFEPNDFDLDQFNKNIKTLTEQKRYQPITLEESKTPIENIDYINDASIHIKLQDISSNVPNADLLKQLDLPFLENYTTKLQKEYNAKGIRLTDTSALSEILNLDSVTLSTHISFNNAYEKNMAEFRSLYRQEDGPRKILEKAIEDRSLIPYVYKIATEESDPVFQTLITNRLGELPSEAKMKNYISTLQITNPEWYENNFEDDSVKQRMAALNIHSILSDISDLEMTEIENIKIAATMFEEAYSFNKFEPDSNKKNSAFQYDHFTYQRTKLELGLGDFYVKETEDETIEYYLNNIRKVYGPKSDKENEFIELIKNNLVSTYF